MKEEKQIPPILKSPYIGLQEAAAYCCASPSTFRQWTRNRLLPSYKVGKRVLYKTVDIEVFVEKHLRRSHEQLDQALNYHKQVLQAPATRTASAVQKGGRLS